MPLLQHALLWLPLTTLAMSPFGSIHAQGREPADSGSRLRVLAYNVKHGLGMDGAIDLERIAAVIRAQDPDVVTLQEIDEGCGRSGGVDQARRLGELCGMQSVFGPFMDYDGGRYGMALLSALPVAESTNHRLPPGAEPRSALEARVALPGGGEALVVGIHLYATEEERLAQARSLVTRFADEDLPVILAGDFNSQRGTKVMELLEEHWDNPPKDGPGSTFPADDPQREIDFVLLRGTRGARVLEQRVLAESVASDHRPLLLTLELPAQRETPRSAPGWTKRSERSMQRAVDGMTLRYLMHVPPGPAPGEGWPLLLFLHGAGERGEDLDAVHVHGPTKLLGEVPQLAECVLVAPQCPGEDWWRSDVLKGLVDEVRASTRLDPRRLYVTGLSMGGYGTWNLVADYPDLFAAAIPICGGGDPARLWDAFAGRPPFDLDGLTRARVPIRAFHGELDGIVPVEESRFLMRALDAAEADAELTVYADVGHDAWTRTYADRALYSWLFAQRRPD